MTRRLLPLLLIFACAFSLQAQEADVTLKYLVLDRYGMNRIKLAEGDRIWFSLKGEKRNKRYRDFIGKLNENDSTIYLANRKTEIKLSEISAFYFHRAGMIWLAGSSTFVGTGFGISALVHPLVSNAQYSRKEHAILSASFLGIVGIIQLFKLSRKRYPVTGNTRVRILDLSFEQKE